MFSNLCWDSLWISPSVVYTTIYLPFQCFNTSHCRILNKTNLCTLNTQLIYNIFFPIRFLFLEGRAHLLSLQLLPVYFIWSGTTTTQMPPSTTMPTLWGNPFGYFQILSGSLCFPFPISFTRGSSGLVRLNHCS